MNEHNEILIKHSIEKSERAIISAEAAISNNDLHTALNRIYYAIFYSVMALGYKYNFTTSKHARLLGWFNKKFIHEDKIFPNEMYQIYKQAYDNRQESDYDLLEIDNIDQEEARLSLSKAKIFFENVKGHMNL
jgi:uncharacterized protein (UPF0332 family)